MFRLVNLRAASRGFGLVWPCLPEFFLGAHSRRRRPRMQSRSLASFSRSSSRSPTRPSTAIRAATRQLVDRQAAADSAARPILVFQFSPGETAPGSSEFGVCYDVASLISRDLAGARADGRLRAPAAQGLCRLARGGLHRDRDGVVGLAGADHARNRESTTQRIGNRCDSWRSARRDSPICFWACSTAMPTCGWCAPPTRRSTTCSPTTWSSSRRRTRSAKTCPAWDAGAAAS